MKLRYKTLDLDDGSVLLVTLFMTALIGFFLFSYMYLVRVQRIQVARSYAWNSALPLAEAGVEEALAQLNPGAPHPIVDRSANGWGQAVSGKYGPLTRNVTNGCYSVIYTSDSAPMIYSTGYVTIPVLNATISREVRVTTTNIPLFMVGLATKLNIDLKGNNVTANSFDSMDPNLSTGGRYDPNKTSTNGDIASVAGLVNVGNADIYGSLLLGPTATDSINNNGLVTGGVTNDFNVDFPDVVLPQTAWLPVSPLLLPALINGTLYNYVFGPPGVTVGGDYVVNGLTGNVYIGTNTNVRLLINGDASPGIISVVGPGAGARLTIYMNGSTFNLTSQSSVDGGNAMNLAYYGTTNNTTVNFSGNASFTGTIYAPEAALSLGGGGNNTYDFVGSSVTKSASMNGHFSFHFDENLMRNGPQLGYLATSWKEF